MKRILLLIGILLTFTGSAFGYTMPRWGLTAIDVYIPENEYSSTVARAFQTWSKATNGKVRFRFNNTRFASNNAPIKVEFSNEPAPVYITTSKRQETTAFFTDMDSGYISSAKLIVYTLKKDKKNPTEQEVYSFALTEIGYILGLDKLFTNCDKDNLSIMCMVEIGKNTSLFERDISEILEKYDRTNEDIRKQKNR